MVNKPAKKLITRQEAAERVGVHPRTIDNWRQAGLLITYRRRGSRSDPRVLIDAVELDRLTRAQPAGVTS